MASADRQYDAFISYSHSSRSRAIARELQARVQTFARPWYKARTARIFRDTTDLSASPDLWADIEAALAESSWFVLLASPEAAASKWVRKEIDWWLREHGSASRILPVLVGGTLEWDEGRRQFSESSTAIPTALRAAYEEEPLWLALSQTSAEPGADPESHSPAQLDHAVASLSARLRGVELDTILGEHVQVARRTRRTITAVVTTLAVLAGAAGVGWVTASLQRDQAERAADIAASRNLVMESERRQGSEVDVALRAGIAADVLDASPRARANLTTALARSRYGGTLPQVTSTVLDVDIAGDGRLAVTAHESGVATIWDLTTPAAAVPLATVAPGIGALRAATFRADGQRLAIGGSDGRVALVDLARPQTPQVQRTLPALRSPVEAVAFDATGARLYVGSDNMRVTTDDGVQIWDVTAGREPQLLRAIPTTSLVQQITTPPTADLVAIAGTSGVELWSADGGRAVGLIDTSDTVYTAVPLPDRTALVVCGQDRTVRIWDIANPAAPVETALLRTDTPAVACAVDRTGAELAVGLGDGSIHTWDVRDPAAPVPTGSLLGHADMVNGLAYTADGLLLSGGRDAKAITWLPVPAAHPVLRERIPAGTGPVTSVGVGPGSRAVASIRTGGPGAEADDPVQRVYRLPDGIRDIRPDDPARRAWLDPSGRLLLLPREGGVDVWELGDDSARPVSALEVPALGPESVAFTADGDRVLLCGQPARDGARTASLWDVSRPDTPVRLVPDAFVEDTVFACALSPDGTRVALATGGTVALWQVPETGAPTVVLEQVASHPAAVQAVVMDPDADVLMTASSDQTVAVWSIATGRRLAVLAGHDSEVVELALSMDGTQLVSRDTVGQVILWDVSVPDLPVELASLMPSGGDRATATALDPEGSTLYVGRATGGIEVWALDGLRALTADPRAAACALTRAGLTQVEWSLFAPEREYRDTC